jgi:hypothetical protein
VVSAISHAVPRLLMNSYFFKKCFGIEDMKICSCLKREGALGSCDGEPPLFICYVNEIWTAIKTSSPHFSMEDTVYAKVRCGMEEYVVIRRGE